MTTELLEQMSRCERTAQRLRVLLVLNALALPLTLSLAVSAFVSTRPNAAQPTDSLRVRALIVVDSNGMQRVRLGGHLAGAGRAASGVQAAGMLLYDDTGRERSGYVTFVPTRSVALTLDTRQQQVALFIADSTQGAAARLWRGKDWVEMKADDEGTHLSVGRNNRLMFQQPPMSAVEKTAACNDLKSELKALTTPPPRQQIMDACMLHLSGSACRRCLGSR